MQMMRVFWDAAGALDPPARELDEGVTVRLYVPADYPEWLRMRNALWPDQTPADMAAWLDRPDAAVFVAGRTPRGRCGFAEVGARPYADGCQTSPVAYLEGWYVDPDMRRRGIGAAVVGAIEAWARAQGYRELASDAAAANSISQRAHKRLGFTDVERVVQYRKEL
jgi:aminoglycoside 6'-N-acetyltransferase I